MSKLDVKSLHKTVKHNTSALHAWWGQKYERYLVGWLVAVVTLLGPQGDGF